MAPIEITIELVFNQPATSGCFLIPDSGQAACSQLNNSVQQYQFLLIINFKILIKVKRLACQWMTSSQYTLDDGYDDIFSSPSLNDSLQNATLIATLAEKFKLTSFKPFQREIIDATLQGKDTLVIYPTGSGKSLCF